MPEILDSHISNT